MRRFLLSTIFALAAFPALAQNPQCPTRPPGDNTNACASTAFVTAAIAGIINGTANYFVYYATANTLSNTSQVYRNPSTSYVSIGPTPTTSPSTQLHVKDVATNVDTRITIEASGANRAGVLATTTFGHYDLVMGNVGVAKLGSNVGLGINLPSGGNYSWITSMQTGSEGWMAVAPGIGDGVTVVPVAHPLMIGPNLSGASTIAPQVTAANGARVGLYRDGSTYYLAQDTTDATSLFMGADSVGGTIATASDSVLRFGAGNGAGSGATFYMTLQRGGAFWVAGSGTDSPTASNTFLYVSANGTTNFAVRDSTNDVEGKFQASNSGIFLGAQTNHPVAMRVNNVSVATYDTSGGYGIGCSASGLSTTFCVTSALQELVKFNSTHASGNAFLQIFGNSGATSFLMGVDAANVLILQHNASTSVGIQPQGSTIYDGVLQLATLRGSGILARTWGLDRNTTAATAGLGLTLKAGGAIAGTNNLAGGNMTIASGISTGTGTSQIIFQTAIVGASGSADNALTTAFSIDESLHLRSHGTAPALSSCGTSPAIEGTDQSGTVTMGTGTPTGCVITFNKAYAAAPRCTVTWRATPLASQSYTVSSTAITLTQTATSSNLIDYVCIARSTGWLLDPANDNVPMFLNKVA